MEWSSWTETNDLNTARQDISITWSNWSIRWIILWRTISAPTSNKSTESWDGSSWTEVNDFHNLDVIKR